MVAAAGEGSRLHTPVAAAWLTGILVALIGLGVFTAKTDLLERIQPPYPPEVLRQKAHDLIKELGYTNRLIGSSMGFYWDSDQIQYASDHDKPRPDLNKLTHGPIPVLYFWYRQSETPLVAQRFKDDKLTPGVVEDWDPPPIESGMISVNLSPEGHLVFFQAIPDQKRRAAPLPTTIDWAKLFNAAHLDASRFHEVAPEWTFLAASDTRKAWMGTARDNTPSLRIEAAALEGRPTAWEVMGPWKKADRNPDAASGWNGSESIWFLVILTVAALTAAPFLAHRNLVKGSADFPGALRAAVFIFVVQLAIWLFRAHFTGSPGTAGMGFIAVATSVFYAAFIWAIYLAFEPQVRRRWPQSLISWSAVLAGKWRDPVVGRDVLYGIAMALSWQVIGYSLHAAFGMLQTEPEASNQHLLLGAREALGAWLLHVPGSIRFALLVFLLLFGLRTWFKREWLASSIFVLIFTVGTFQGKIVPAHVLINVLIYTTIVVVVFRAGVLSLILGLLFVGVLESVPVTFDTSAWYFGNAMFFYFTAAALAIAAFRIAIKPAPNSAALR